MTNKQRSPFSLAKELSPEIENILGVTDLDIAIDSLNEDMAHIDANNEMRGISPGEIASIAGFIVGTVAFIQQIIAGHTMQDASRDQIVERLLLRISEAQDLTPIAKERLIHHLIDHMLPNDPM